MQITVINSILAEWKDAGLLAGISRREKKNGDEVLSINLSTDFWQIANNQLRLK